jgi:hypothetical protein
MMLRPSWLKLETTQVSLAATHDKLTTKSTALNTQVIREQHVKIQLTKAEEKLKAAEGELKTERQSLESVQQVLSKHEVSSSMVIALVVDNAAALFKSHIPDLDMEILCKDFPIDDMEREALAHSAYDAAHEFVSLYDFSGLGEFNDDKSPGAM